MTIIMTRQKTRVKLIDIYNVRTDILVNTENITDKNIATNILANT